MGRDSASETSSNGSRKHLPLLHWPFDERSNGSMSHSADERLAQFGQLLGQLRPSPLADQLVAALLGGVRGLTDELAPRWTIGMRPWFDSMHSASRGFSRRPDGRRPSLPTRTSLCRCPTGSRRIRLSQRTVLESASPAGDYSSRASGSRGHSPSSGRQPRTGADSLVGSGAPPGMREETQELLNAAETCRRSDPERAIQLYSAVLELVPDCRMAFVRRGLLA